VPVAVSQMVGGQNVETVVAHDVIGRMMIQCARQPGLAQIWETLLGFEHCEFYAKPWPQLEGTTFKDALLSFPEAVPIGLKVQGYTVLNPNDDYVLQPGDEVLVIAEDDDSYAPRPRLPSKRPCSLLWGSLPRFRRRFCSVGGAATLMT